MRNQGYVLLALVWVLYIEGANGQQFLPGADTGCSNTAIIPVPKLEEDSYNWYDRHAAVLAIKDSVKPGILLIGDSITHFWGGQPQLKYADGSPRQPNGPVSWDKLFKPYRVLNLGFGWDRTQNVLWRLDNGEIKGLHPKIVIINIGTNNTSTTSHAQANSPAEITDGIMAVYARVHTELPSAKIILMAVFPREQEPGNARRLAINQVNKLLEGLTSRMHITFLNVAPVMLNSQGYFKPGMMLDFTHPSDKGYMVWADALRPYINKYVKTQK